MRDVGVGPVHRVSGTRPAPRVTSVFGGEIHEYGSSPTTVSEVIWCGRWGVGPSHKGVGGRIGDPGRLRVR